MTLKTLSATASVLQLLQRYESRNVTYMDPAGNWPIVWERAHGAHVWDAEGRRYLDLTAAFGVAAAGHANPRVVAAGQKQMETLLHAMGDVHPHRLKAELAERLSGITFERWTRRGERHQGKTIFCNSGFEAVEAALKTAFLATGRPGVIAFEGGYHGLGYGALATTHREHFRRPFHPQIAQFGRFAPFPENERELERTEKAMRKLLRGKEVGCVLVEPVQARGGIRVPPPRFLAMLRALCDRHGMLLVLDEIYTGFGRTGRWFGCEHSGTVPDLICLGKALSGGFPLSACVGRAGLMDRAWPASSGEAIHTSTFLGHPVGCAMALAQINEIQRNKLVLRSERLGKVLQNALSQIRPAEGIESQARGIGLMAGLELRRAGRAASEEALGAIQELLRRGFILLPEGEYGNVISFTPPLTISTHELDRALRALQAVLQPRSAA